MEKEMEYTKQADAGHIKEFGQYFTNYDAARFMVKWACESADTVLDPAAGNSIFLTYAREENEKCRLTGYEIDKSILDYFGNPAGVHLINDDYLMQGWTDKYDAIICNPPYNRFQAVGNREQILQMIEKYTGIKYSGYTNLYILFLLKSLYQLSDTGRLAYIIPTEFFNSKYGIPIKEKLIRERLLKCIINFKNDQNIFFHATTTCCIMLIDRTPKEYASFYNLDKISELENIDVHGQEKGMAIKYADLDPEEKWRIYISHERKKEYSNLRQVSGFCSVSRGIATGDNHFFCLSKTRIKELSLPEEAFSKCICKSADVKRRVFRYSDFCRLANEDKVVYLLDVKGLDDKALSEYINEGEERKIHKKYLLSHRHPWYSMEQKPAAPIWVSSACRGRIKFIRNLAGVKSLTTFHSIFINREYENDIDIIFCYFLTPLAQEIIRQNRKKLGNGLDKFQPNDLMTAQMLDISLISEEDKKDILDLYESIKEDNDEKNIGLLNDIFKKYLCEK